MRIGVNVPNELLKRVKEIEPRVNISQVCRKALESRVDTAERAKGKANAESVEEHVAKLVESGNASMIEPDWEAYALKDAAFWISTATPEEWDQFIDVSNLFLERGQDKADIVKHWSDMRKNKGLRYRLYVQHWDWFTSQLELRHGVPGGPDPYEKATQEYSLAWLSYVNEIRRKIDQHYKDEYKRVMAERAAYRQSLPKPEVPSQLI